jgi:O-antigen/teichoic acid export membrane protein
LFTVQDIREIVKDVHAKGFFHFLSSNIILAIIGFGSQLMVAKFLAPEELGQIKTLQSFSAVGVIVAGCGFNVAVLKLCAEKRPFIERSFILQRNLWYTLWPSVCVLGLLFICSMLRILSPDQSVNHWMPLYMLAVPAWAYIYLIMSYLQALKEIKAMAKVQTVIRIFGLAGVVAATYFLGMRGYMYMTILMVYCMLIALLLMVRTSFTGAKPVSNVFSKSWGYGKWGFAINALETAGQWIDILILNYLVTDRAEFGYYALSTVFLMGLNQVSWTVQGIAAPYFSEKSQDPPEFIRVLRKYRKLMLFLSFCIAAVTIVVVPEAIKTLYGESYSLAGLYFRFLVVKYFLLSQFALPGTAIFGLGKMHYNFIGSLISVCVGALSIYVGAQAYGVMGAVIGQLFSTFIVLIMWLYILQRAIKTSFSPSYKIGYWL